MMIVMQEEHNGCKEPVASAVLALFRAASCYRWVIDRSIGSVCILEQLVTADCRT